MKTETHSINLDNEALYLVSDLHSNLPALESVLQEIPVNAQIVCAGDLVGYYCEPNEVCELLRKRSIACIKGNHDRYVLNELPYPSEREFKYRIQETRQELTTENRDWLKNLPDRLCLQVESQALEDSSRKLEIHIMHGSPSSCEDYIYSDTTINLSQDEIKNFLILGHTHHPMLRYEDGLTIINPGSVGQPRDRIPGACYASLNPLSGAVRFCRAQYSISTYQLSLKLAGITPSMIEVLSRLK